MSALDDLVRTGKVRYLGCSNFAAWQLTQALWVCDRRGYTPFVSVQPRYSLLDRAIEAELVPACRAFGVGVIPYSPLAGGILTGKYRGGARPEGSRGADQEGAGFFQRQLAGKDEGCGRAAGRVGRGARTHDRGIGDRLADLTAGSLHRDRRGDRPRAGGSPTSTRRRGALTADEVKEVGALVG